MTTPLTPAATTQHGRNMRKAGFWLDKTVDSFLNHQLASDPKKLAVVSYKANNDSPRRISYHELGHLVDKAAAALSGLGVNRGDVVSVQLPNCWEFVVISLACVRIGATINPIVPILREREVRFMVEFCEAKVLIVPKIFRQFDHAQMAHNLRDSLPQLQHVIVVGEDGPEGFEQMLISGHEVMPFDPLQPRLMPDDLMVLMYTSGTTGEPKGVMHTSNTVNGNVLRFGSDLGLNSDDVFFGATPVGHMTGYGIFVMLPIMMGNTLVLQDIHDPRTGIRIMQTESVTFSAGATPFLADLLDSVNSEGIRPATLRRFYCAGAPIPPILIQRAWNDLKLTVSSVWGMTEIIAGTMTEPSKMEKAWTTDGRAIPGIEVKVVDEAGQSIPNGETGRLLVRGASMFCGYLKRPDLYLVSADGWFDSGDLARMDEEGYIRITGRTKDILIRGGENVPVIEIENILMSHPAIAMVAIVGIPDARLGERGCAFVVTRQGQDMNLTIMQAYLDTLNVAKPFWPERVECVAEIPCTPSGKVQRFLLKQMASQFSIG